MMFSLPQSARLAGLELGGTKAIAILAEQGLIKDRAVYTTTTASETLQHLISSLNDWQGDAPIDAIGIASFGPIRVDTAADDFGCLLATPKASWAGFNIYDAVRAHFSCPIRLDTDVNAACLAEARLGATPSAGPVIYLTIGTGVGGGICINGKPVHGRMHPEIGHMRLRRIPDDVFPGTCPVHGDCIEGLISGPALAARLGQDPAQCPADHPLWEHAARDLGELLATLIFTVSPQHILVGGSVAIGQPHMLARAIDHTHRVVHSYLTDLSRAQLGQIISLPTLAPDSGPIGALQLAINALTDKPYPG